MSRYASSPSISFSKCFHTERAVRRPSCRRCSRRARNASRLLRSCRFCRSFSFSLRVSSAFSRSRMYSWKTSSLSCCERREGGRRNVRDVKRRILRTAVARMPELS